MLSGMKQNRIKKKSNNRIHMSNSYIKCIRQTSTNVGIHKKTVMQRDFSLCWLGSRCYCTVTAAVSVPMNSLPFHFFVSFGILSSSSFEHIWMISTTHILSLLFFVRHDTFNIQCHNILCSRLNFYSNFMHI